MNSTTIFVDLETRSGQELIDTLRATGRWAPPSEASHVACMNSGRPVCALEGRPMRPEPPWLDAKVIEFYTRKHRSRGGRSGYGFVRLGDERRAFIHQAKLVEWGRHGVAKWTKLQALVSDDGRGLVVSRVRAPQGVICPGTVVGVQGTEFALVGTERFERSAQLHISKFARTGKLPELGTRLVVEVYDREWSPDGLVVVRVWDDPDRV